MKYEEAYGMRYASARIVQTNRDSEQCNAERACCRTNLLPSILFINKVISYHYAETPVTISCFERDCKS